MKICYRYPGLNSSDCENKYSLLIAVIALSILLGIISLACLTAYLVRRFRARLQQVGTFAGRFIILTLWKSIAEFCVRKNISYISIFSNLLVISSRLVTEIVSQQLHLEEAENSVHNYRVLTMLAYCILLFISSDNLNLATAENQKMVILYLERSKVNCRFSLPPLLVVVEVLLQVPLLLLLLVVVLVLGYYY